MKKTIEIYRVKDVREGDKLYLEAAPDRAYTIIDVDDGEDGLPYCINMMEYLDDTTRRIIDRLNVTPRREWWFSPDSVSRITRAVDVPEWPTPDHNAAYRGADGRMYVYMLSDDDDMLSWLCKEDEEYPVWHSRSDMAINFSDALPLTELVPRPEPRHITDITKVHRGFIVFAKGCSTPFVCVLRDHNKQRDIYSASYTDSLICASGKLPDELSAKNGDSLAHCWLRNDMFDYAIEPIDALGLGGGDEKC